MDKKTGKTNYETVSASVRTGVFQTADLLYWVGRAHEHYKQNPNRGFHTQVPENFLERLEQFRTRLGYLLMPHMMPVKSVWGPNGDSLFLRNVNQLRWMTKYLGLNIGTPRSYAREKLSEQLLDYLLSPFWRGTGLHSAQRFRTTEGFQFGDLTWVSSQLRTVHWIPEFRLSFEWKFKDEEVDLILEVLRGTALQKKPKPDPVDQFLNGAHLNGTHLLAKSDSVAKSEPGHPGEHTKVRPSAENLPAFAENLPAFVETDKSDFADLAFITSLTRRPSEKHVINIFPGGHRETRYFPPVRSPLTKKSSSELEKQSGYLNDYLDLQFPEALADLDKQLEGRIRIPLRDGIPLRESRDPVPDPHHPPRDPARPGGPGPGSHSAPPGSHSQLPPRPDPSVRVESSHFLSPFVLISKQSLSQSEARPEVQVEPRSPMAPPNLSKALRSESHMYVIGHPQQRSNFNPQMTALRSHYAYLRNIMPTGYNAPDFEAEDKADDIAEFYQGGEDKPVFEAFQEPANRNEADLRVTVQRSETSPGDRVLSMQNQKPSDIAGK
jgi:hypothetical protein